MNFDGPAISQMRRPATRAKVQPRAACYGDNKFTSTDHEDAAAAVAICRTICRLKECRAVMRDLTLGERANIEGTWDGKFYVNGTLRETPKRGAA